MKHLWERMEKNSEIPTYDVDILSLLVYSPYKELGEIREAFNNWSIHELESTANQIYWTRTEDDGATAETNFGERDEHSYHPYRECQLIQSHADTHWKLSSSRKKFF